MIPCSNSLKNHNLKRERCTKRMGSEKEFLQKLKELLDIAAVSGNRITTEEVGVNCQRSRCCLYMITCSRRRFLWSDT